MIEKKKREKKKINEYIYTDACMLNFFFFSFPNEGSSPEKRLKKKRKKKKQKRSNSLHSITHL